MRVRLQPKVRHQRRPYDSGVSESNMDEQTKQVTKSQSDTVREMMGLVEEKLKSGQVKPTLGDYIRLLQLQRELEGEEPSNIEVKWVESENSDQ